MALVRGMVYKGYTCDDGTTVFQTLVDADEAAIAARGWAAVTVGGDFIPRGFKERRANGVSATTGRRGSCRVGSTTADLWTGVATTFTVEADDNTLDTMTVTSRTGEKRRLSHQSLIRPSAVGGGIAPVYESIFGATPPTTYPDDLALITLGVQVLFTTDGLIVGARYYRDAGDDGQHWAIVRDGTNAVAERFTVFKQAPAGGAGVASWQHAYFRPYVKVAAGERKVIDVFFEKGHWWYTPAMYAGGDVVSGSITAPHRAAGSFFQGVFGYNEYVKTTGDGGGNGYGVDLLFLPRP